MFIIILTIPTTFKSNGVPGDFQDPFDIAIEKIQGLVMATPVATRPPVCSKLAFSRSLERPKYIDMTLISRLQLSTLWTFRMRY